MRWLLIFLGSEAILVGIIYALHSRSQGNQGIQGRIVDSIPLPGCLSPSLSSVFSSVLQWKALADQNALKYGVPSSLILAVIHRESSGNPDAVSFKGAIGLMQVMPATARGLGYKGSNQELKNPNINVDLGTRLLSILLQQYNGDLQRTLADYNGGTRFATPDSSGCFMNQSYVNNVVGSYIRYSQTG